MRTSLAAIGHWAEIFEHYGLPPITGKKHYKGPCPLCGKKNKFRIDNRSDNGSWICVCDHGNGFDLVMKVKGMDYLEVAKEIDQIIGNVNDENHSEIRLRDHAHHNKLEYYNSLIKIENSPVVGYLNSRGIYTMPQHSMRFSHKEYATSVKCDLPAMYCLAVNKDNKIKYVHKTFLIGNNKANIDSPKQMEIVYEYSGSVAVKLFGHGSILGIAEGVETALSTTQMFRVPTWAALNSAFLKRFVAPNGVKILCIFADNDLNGTGLAAAFACGRSNILKKAAEKVYIVWPLRSDSDFNDIINDDPPEFFSWVLTP